MLINSPIFYTLHKRLVLGLLLSVCTWVAKAEEVFVFGSLKINKENSVPFGLELDISKQGKVSGFSITYAGSVDETRARVIGYYDKKTKVLSFKEVSLASDREQSSHKEIIYCFLSAHLQHKIIDGQNVYQGLFTSQQENSKTPCSTGSIDVFDQNNHIQNIFAPHTKTILEKEYALAPLNVDSIQEDTTRKVITPYQSRRIDWLSEQVFLEISDDGEYDGDRVLITLNDKAIAPAFTLSPISRKYSLLLQSGKNTLNIKAMNNGRTVPNSARLLLQDASGHQVTVLCYNHAGEQSFIELYLK